MIFPEVRIKLIYDSMSSCFAASIEAGTAVGRCVHRGDRSGERHLTVILCCVGQFFECRFQHQERFALSGENLPGFGHSQK